MLSLARSDPVTGQGLLILARPHDEFQILDHLTRKKTFFMAAKTKALTFTPPKHLSKESTEFFRKALGDCAHHGLDRRAERAKVSLADQSPFGIERPSMLVGSSKPN
jgi:hypothetical protein